MPCRKRRFLAVRKQLPSYEAKKRDVYYSYPRYMRKNQGIFYLWMNAGEIAISISLFITDPVISYVTYLGGIIAFANAFGGTDMPHNFVNFMQVSEVFFLLSVLPRAWQATSFWQITGKQAHLKAVVCGAY